jgi:hypothetical protein
VHCREGRGVLSSIESLTQPNARHSPGGGKQLGTQSVDPQTLTSSFWMWLTGKRYLSWKLYLLDKADMISCGEAHHEDTYTASSKF